MKTRMAVLLAFLLMVAGFFLGQARARTVALPQGTPPKVCTIPKAWGTFKDFYWSGHLAFEDSSGTVRFFSLDGCTKGNTIVEYEIHRH